jgi:cell division protein FtsZ
LNFEESTPQVEATEEEEEKIVFNLEDTDEEVEAKREEDTNWNWSEVNEGEIEAGNMDDTPEFSAETSEEPTEEKKTIVWNLNDDDSTEEFTAETEDFTSEAEETTFETKEDNTEKEEGEEEGPVYTNRIPDEEQLKRSQERIMKIKELGMKMKTPSGINDLENEPAYKRRKINLDEVPHSSENPISRFTLSDDDEGKPKLNDDNSFLHDNVD